MNIILHITSSMRGAESISRTLSTKLIEHLATESTTVLERDLSKNELPFIDEATFTANLTEKSERSESQKQLAQISDTLIDELEQADTLVLAIPIYNFGVPAIFKAWADLVARAGRTFKYTENGPVGLLEGKKAYLIAVSGGTPIGADFDFMSPWVKFFLGFIGIHDVEIIAADGIAGKDAAQKIEAAQNQIKNIAA